MSRKCKFDLQWEQALSLLDVNEATQAREVIEMYQSTGVMPEGLSDRQTMILLLVKPLIDRRRRAAESARKRRLSAKQKAEQPRPADAVEAVEVENTVVEKRVGVSETRSDRSVKKDNRPKWFKRKKRKHSLATLRKR